MRAREQAAIAVILNGTEPDSLDLLLIQRAECAGDPWSGHMALPGGRRDESDVDLRATGVRETREETGVELEQARWLGRLDDLRPIRQSERALAVRPFVYWSATRPALTLSSEVADAFWVPLADLRAAATEARVLHRGESLIVPAFQVGGRTVWGMTQRVLAALLDLT
jgi:8-oxo-dGTP pyrophosphatase MutT (NUDIX family)